MKSLFGNILYIVTDQYPHIRYVLNAEIIVDLLLQILRLYPESFLLFHIYTSYTTHKSSSIPKVYDVLVTLYHKSFHYSTL